MMMITHATPQPADAIVAITGRCNARCRMCNVWRQGGADGLAPADMDRLPRMLKTVNLTGGEPFLRKDLARFVRHIRKRCPAAVITISTNGLLREVIIDQLPELLAIDPGVRLAVSLDGVGEAHDHIRGVEGAFERVVALLDVLQQADFTGLRLSMTLTEENLDQLAPVAAFAAQRGLELGLVAAHEAEVHLSVEADTFAPAKQAHDLIDPVVRRWLRSWRPKQWLRAHFAFITADYLAGRRPTWVCQAASRFFFLRNDGEVFGCSVCSQPMGNLKTQTWAELWASERAAAVRAAAGACKKGCWMICTARWVYRRHAWGVIGWILRHKIAAHLKRRESE